MTHLDILVIDDEEVRHEWFRVALKRLGHTMTSAYRSVEALRLLRTHRYDLAFFDHDLVGEQATGSTIAGAVLHNPESYQCPRAVWVHSANPVGALNIASKFRSASIPILVLDFFRLSCMPAEAMGELLAELFRHPF